MIFELAAAMTVTAVILEIWLVWRFRFPLELFAHNSLIRRPARLHLLGNRG